MTFFDIARGLRSCTMNSQAAWSTTMLCASRQQLRLLRLIECRLRLLQQSVDFRRAPKWPQL